MMDVFFFINYALLHAVPSPSFNDIRLFSVMIILMFDFQLFLKDWFVVIFSIDKHGKEIQKVFAFEGRNFFWGKVKKEKEENRAFPNFCTEADQGGAQALMEERGGKCPLHAIPSATSYH